MTYVNAQGNTVPGESDIANARITEPEGSVCAFCGKENDNADDCGWFYIWPDGTDGNNGAACQQCSDGELGDRHREKFGVGER